MRLTKTFKRAIAFISDMHVGSSGALWPEGMVTDTEEGDRELPPSDKQRIINSYWEEGLATLDEFEVDTIFLMGDLVHGNNRFDGGRQLMTPNLDTQKEACIKFLEPAVKNRPIYGVSGSRYHDSFDVRLDRSVVQKLGGKFLGQLANVPLKDTNRIIQVTHGVSGAVIYKEMVPARYRMFLDAAEGQGKLPFHIDMVVQGHMHYFMHMHGEHGHSLQCPCWCDWMPWKGALHYYGKMLPDLGFCILLIDEKDRMTVFPFLHKRPLVGDGLREPT